MNSRLAAGMSFLICLLLHAPCAAQPRPFSIKAKAGAQSLYAEIKDSTGYVYLVHPNKTRTLLISGPVDSVHIKEHVTYARSGGQVLIYKTFYSSDNGNTFTDVREFRKMLTRHFHPYLRTAFPVLHKDCLIMIYNTRDSDEQTEQYISCDGGASFRNNAIIFQASDPMPHPGYDLQHYINRNLRYSQSARERGVEGKVTVQFVVNEDGVITSPALKNGFDAECNREALRLVSSMPPWKPGKLNGKPVKVEYTLPIMFGRP